MKNLLKILPIILVLSISVSFLSSCSVSKSEIWGTWKETNYHNGDYWERYYKFNIDMTYAYLEYKNGEIYDSGTGAYEIRGNKVRIHLHDIPGGWADYKYRNGKLHNGTHEYSKAWD